jgi:LPS-assembly protein
LSNETINQIGLSAAYPLSDRWQWVGRWYHDQEQNRTIETYTGLQYESCCWSIRLVAQRQLLNRYQLDGQRDINNFDSGVSLQFSFKGLSSNQQNANMLLDGMFGYRQPYFTQ